MNEADEIVKNSNCESLLFNHKLIGIKQHLAINKLLVPVSEKIDSKGFFKIHNGLLQLHVKIPGVGWFWFYVVDANDDQVSLNKRLNLN